MQRKAFPRPFAGSYGVMLTVAILAIAPFIVVTTAAALYRGQIASDLGANLTSLAIISGLANAGYAFGALLGGDLTQRFAQRKVFLAFFATALPFWAAGELTGHGFSSYRFMIPLAVGFVCFVALLLTQYHKKEPLSPVELLWHTYPLLGTVAAMIGGGAFIAFTLLIQAYETEILGLSPLQTGLAFWPQVIGVLVTAVLLGALLRTRLLPVLTLFGMLLLIASGGALLFAFGPMGSDKLLLGVIGMLGLGAGATVSPGLFMAAMSLPSQIVGRTLALVELVRSEADFILAPVMLQAARLESGGHGLTQAGIRQAILITAMIAGATTFLGILLYLGSAGARLPKPDLVSWLGHSRPAFDSPAFWTVLRRKGARE